MSSPTTAASATPSPIATSPPVPVAPNNSPASQHGSQSPDPAGSPIATESLGNSITSAVVAADARSPALASEAAAIASSAVPEACSTQTTCGVAADVPRSPIATNTAVKPPAVQQGGFYVAPQPLSNPEGWTAPSFVSNNHIAADQWRGNINGGVPAQPFPPSLIEQEALALGVAVPSGSMPYLHEKEKPMSAAELQEAFAERERQNLAYVRRNLQAAKRRAENPDEPEGPYESCMSTTTFSPSIAGMPFGKGYAFSAFGGPVSQSKPAEAPSCDDETWNPSLNDDIPDME